MITIANDKLERSQFLDELFNIFDNFGNQDDGGLAISLNGKYGSGKSTLLSFIEEKNFKEQKYNIVKYNAWVNNFFDNPLIPILYSLIELESKKSKLFSSAKNIVKCFPKILTGTLSNIHGIDLTSLVTNENIFNDYKKYSEAIQKYRTVMADYCAIKKTILLIDELDRCLPEYQIKVLETLYNIFNLPNLIFVIALDRNQLDHSVKQIFGDKENVSGYLSKFIQYEVDLPDDKTDKYMQTLLMFNCKYPEIKKICAHMFSIAKISIRNCLQIVKELNLICNETDREGKTIQYNYWYPLFVCLILIVKKENKKIYNEYFYNPRIMHATNTNIVKLENTLYNNFLKDIVGTNIEKIIDYFKSDDMNFPFILHFINYFNHIKHIQIESLVSYTNYEQERIEGIIDNWEMPMWREEKFNTVLNQIRIFKK